MSFLDLEIVKYPKPFHTLPTPACLLHAGVGAVAGLLPDCFSLSRSLRSGCGSLVGIARVRSGTRNPESPFKLSNARLLAALLHLTEAILCCSGDRRGRTPCVDPRGVLPSSQFESHLPAAEARAEQRREIPGSLRDREALEFFSCWERWALDALW